MFLVCESLSDALISTYLWRNTLNDPRIEICRTASVSDLLVMLQSPQNKSVKGILVSMDGMGTSAEALACYLQENPLPLIGFTAQKRDRHPSASLLPWTEIFTVRDDGERSYVIDLLTFIERRSHQPLLVVGDIPPVLLEWSQQCGMSVIQCENGEAVLSALDVSVSEAAESLVTAHANIAPWVCCAATLHGDINTDALVRTIRQHYLAEEVGIVVFSETVKPQLAAKFFRYGVQECFDTTWAKSAVLARIVTHDTRSHQLQAMRPLLGRDLLTGMWNRETLLDVGEKIFRAAERANGNIVVALLRVQSLKHVNDTFGVSQGDRVMVDVARLVQCHVRSSDLVGRYDGATLAILFVGTQAKEIAPALRTIGEKIIATEILVENAHRLPWEIRIASIAQSQKKFLETLPELETMITRDSGDVSPLKIVEIDSLGKIRVYE
ncbi:GGDEF domain-containing protein [Chrysiogenes arsenatis]|uniref:GGDEF domain-containing protein n=1 Tax=Chrysiogenes arsenatis TaxID=309797 RepID=UPI0004119868|nr:GGDEF domain-containing protein [Chrysiogenes arsenatis]